MTSWKQSICYWNYDIARDEIEVSQGLAGIGMLRKAADFFACIHSEDRSRVRWSLLRSLLKRRDLFASFRAPATRGGEAALFQISAHAQLDADQKVVAIGGSIQDISGYVHSHSRSAEDRHNALFELSAVGVVYVNCDGYVVRSNRKFCSMVGYNQNEMSGLRIVDFTHPDDIALAASERSAMVAGIKLESSFEKRYVHRDGHSFWVHVTVSKVAHVERDPANFVAIIQDIDQRRRHEEERRESERVLEDARRLAISASQAKNSFLANMSHEIRTPLGIILGYSELLKMPHLSDAEKEAFLQIIIRNGSDLAGLIDNILELAKAEADKMPIECRNFSLAKLLEDVMTSLKLKADAKNLRLHMRASADLPMFIHSDPSRLKQILLNVIGNAIKFTEQGTIEISAEGGGGSHIHFLIKDSGCGIDLERRDRLFLPFSQLDDSSTRRHGGGGLGLVLSKRLAQALGGDLILQESTPGVGSCFLLSIQPLLS